MCMIAMSRPGRSSMIDGKFVRVNRTVDGMGIDSTELGREID